MERSDSDGDDAMAYFLPNGITDDSPPKRSTLMHSSFGSIGARFGSLHQASPRTAAPTSLFGDLADPLTCSSTSLSTSAGNSSSSSSFLLSDLGGEIHQPRATDSNNLIGGGRHHYHATSPFAFSGAFASLSSEPSASIGRAFENKRHELGGASELFASSSASSLYGQPTLNANAPVFMASNQPEPLTMGSSSASPSAWPTSSTSTTAASTVAAQPTKPRRAPPGLSKPSEDLSPSMANSVGGDKPSGSLSHPPPGLSRPSPFGGVYSTTAAHPSSASFFSDGGAHQFSSASMQPQYASLSDPFLTGISPSDRGFKSALSELNAKSMSVDEIQSSLAATAIAAAHDVMDDDSRQVTAAAGAATQVTTTPQRTSSKSPRQAPEFGRGKPPHEKRGASTTTDLRLRTPTRRNEMNSTTSTATGTTASSMAAGAASPVAHGRRGRHAKESAVSDTPPRAAKMDTNVKTGRRARGTAGGHAPTEARPESRGTLADAIAAGTFQSTASRKKPPSSVSSVGSDDQLLAVSTLIDVAEEGGVARGKQPTRESKPLARGSQAKTKPSPATQSTEKRAVSRRQVYREKHAAAEVAKEEAATIPSKHGEMPHGGSDADASGGDSPPDEVVGEELKVEVAEQETQAATSTTVSNKPPVQPTAAAAVESPVINAEDTSASETSSSDQLEPPASPINVPSTPPIPASPVPAAVEAEKIKATQSTAEVTKPTVVADAPSAVVESASVTADTPPEFDSGSEVRDVVPRGPRQSGSDRKISAKETKKEKHKKDKSDKKKSSLGNKTTKKEKRDSSSSGKGDLMDDEPFNLQPAKKLSPFVDVKIGAALRECRVFVKRMVVSVCAALWFACTEFADRINLRGFLGWSFSYMESFLAVAFSVVLLLSLHGASWFIRVHRVAFRAVLTHRHVGFCFAFLYAFPFLVQYVFPWAPPWAPVCLWYAFLVQLFCTSGPTATVATFRVVIPLVFVVEGISHHSFLLDLNGAELLLSAFVLSAMKTSNLCSPIFLLSLAIQCLTAVFLGSEFIVQWFQMALALYSLHAMAATDEDWAGLGDDEDDVSCRPMAMHHHSIADYNYNPVPSGPPIQKTKRLDRRALAYVRGRKFR